MGFTAQDIQDHINVGSYLWDKLKVRVNRDNRNYKIKTIC